MITPAAVTPAPPFTQCPAVGLNTGCRLLIVINPDGTVDILVDPSQADTYDDDDDTLIGVQNNSDQIVQSIDLSSTTLPIFGFDDDGVCTVDPAPADCPDENGFGETGYEGPHVVFSNINEETSMSGTVNFTNQVSATECSGLSAPITGLAPGASAYFALEDTVSETDVSLARAPTAQPCPTTTTAAPPEEVVSGTGLARTGQNTMPLVELGIVLLSLGGGFIAAGKRREFRFSPVR